MQRTENNRAIIAVLRIYVFRTFVQDVGVIYAPDLNVRRLEMVTVEQWDSGQVKLTNEWFDPIFSDICFFKDFPFPTIIGFKGRKTGIVLHPDFDDILEFI